MALSDTRIHQMELLITLDYLLHYTDEDHPATQIKICEHANNFGLKYDKTAASGNQVRRDRIGDCLKFLEEVSNNYPDSVPFVLEKTDSGKYYIEQKHSLNENQIAKILAAIKNDRFTKKDDVNLLQERILDAFATTEDNKEIIKHQYKRMIRNKKKLDGETLRKLLLIEKAYNKNMLIKVETNPALFIGVNKKNVYHSWYRVCHIKEIHGEIYALMILVGDLSDKPDDILRINSDQYIFNPIKNINIPNESDRNILLEDEKDRDLDKLFKEKCPNSFKRFGTIDKMLENNIFPKNGETIIVYFYFNHALLKAIKSSFEDFFAEDLKYKTTNDIDKFPRDDIIPRGTMLLVDKELNDLESKMYCVSKVIVNKSAFKSWLLSDPYGNGLITISDVVKIISPTELNEEVANYYYFQLANRIKDLNLSLKRNLKRIIDKDLERKEEN